MNDESWWITLVWAAAFIGCATFWLFVALALIALVN